MSSFVAAHPMKAEGPPYTSPPFPPKELEIVPEGFSWLLYPTLSFNQGGNTEAWLGILVMAQVQGYSL